MDVGKYYGMYKDRFVKSFAEVWTYEDENGARYKEMMERSAELMKDSYMPEKIEGVYY